jgi:hypothetical protein
MADRWRQITGTSMVARVHRRTVSRMVFALVAAQFLCAPSAVQALAAITAAHSDNAHCAEVMSPGDSDACPCCEDGSQSVAACLSNCTATTGAVPTFEIPATRATPSRVPARPLGCLAALADPPLNPPPIA